MAVKRTAKLEALNLNLDQIQAIADVILKKNNQYRLPVNAAMLITADEFVIMTSDLGTSTTGTLLVDDENYVLGLATKRLIVLNRNLCYEKKRFVSAHEYAHYKLHKKDIRQFAHRDEGSTDKPEEKEADMFARCLLMPKGLIRAEVDKLKVSETLSENFKEFVIKYIAQRCEVTIKKAEVRLRELEILN